MNDIGPYELCTRVTICNHVCINAARMTILALPAIIMLGVQFDKDLCSGAIVNIPEALTQALD